jgi:DNA-directed RNA polymerase subunit alpha
LLSALEGYAITSVQGVDHEFSTISGVVEDVTEIIYLISKVRFKRQIEDDNQLLFLFGKDQLTAGDFQKIISGFQVLESTCYL